MEPSIQNLAIGDVVVFSTGDGALGWPDPSSDTLEGEIGIITDIDLGCSEGEPTYRTMCSDGRLRFFIIEDALRIVSKLDSNFK